MTIVALQPQHHSTTSRSVVTVALSGRKLGMHGVVSIAANLLTAGICVWTVLVATFLMGFVGGGAAYPDAVQARLVLSLVDD